MFIANIIITLDKVIQGHTNNRSLQICDMPMDGWEAVAKDLPYWHSGTKESNFFLFFKSLDSWEAKKAELELQPLVVLPD